MTLTRSYMIQQLPLLWAMGQVYGPLNDIPNVLLSIIDAWEHFLALASQHSHNVGLWWNSMDATYIHHAMEVTCLWLRMDKMTDDSLTKKAFTADRRLKGCQSWASSTVKLPYCLLLVPWALWKLLLQQTNCSLHWNKNLPNFHCNAFLALFVVFCHHCQVLQEFRNFRYKIGFC